MSSFFFNFFIPFSRKGFAVPPWFLDWKAKQAWSKNSKYFIVAISWLTCFDYGLINHGLENCMHAPVSFCTLYAKAREVAQKKVYAIHYVSIFFPKIANITEMFCLSFIEASFVVLWRHKGVFADDLLNLISFSLQKAFF